MPSSRFSLALQGVWGTVIIGVLTYGWISSTVARWNLPSNEEQINALKREIQLVDINQHFASVDSEPFCFSVQKTANCSKLFYASDDVESTKLKYIKIHEKTGWKKVSKNPDFYGKNDVELAKGNIRSYCIIKKNLT